MKKWHVGMKNGANANMVFEHVGENPWEDTPVCVVMEIPQNRSIDEVGDAEGLANAHKIAAAPEMLEALKVAVTTIKNLQFELNTCYGDGALEEIEAAIAKAEGK